MRMVRLATDCFVPSDNILFCCALKGKSITDKVRELKKMNKVYDYTFGKKTGTVVFLKNDNGAILSPISVETINSRCEKDGVIRTNC